MKNGKIIYSRSIAEFSEQYIKALNNGELVLHPCECSYCISFDFYNENLRERVNMLKGRACDKNYVAIIPSMRSLKKLDIEPNKLERQFMKKYWPDLLKIAFSDTYCLGVPKEKWLRDTLKKINPLVGITSANKTGDSLAKKGTDIDKGLIRGVDKVLINDALIYADKQSTIVRLKKGIEILRQGEVEITERTTKAL